MEILTKSDLEIFKAELLNEISKLVSVSQHPLPKYLSSAEVKQVFQLSETKLYELRRDSKIPYLKVDGKYLYDYQDVVNAFKAAQS